MRLVHWAGMAAAMVLAGRDVEARACGGCFSPPVQGNDNGTVVTGHRMALSLSADQTILWDQIQYSGSPSEFAWVLPIKPGATVEIASEAWFDVLEAATGTSVSPPRLSCAAGQALGCDVSGAASSFGCANSASGSGGPSATGPDPVRVVSQGAAGPYESVVIQSTVPGALSQWLLAHGYAIPTDITPIIDAYEAEGFDFAALRLLPAAGVNQMRPVRIRQPGAVPTLPLRMVAAGTGARTAITLFVLGEGRYTTQNFPEVPVLRDFVSWDFNASQSTYAGLRDAALLGGHEFMSPYAEHGPLFTPVIDPITQYASVYLTTKGGAFTTIGETFVEQAVVNGETSSTQCEDEYADLGNDERRVVMPCDAKGNCSVIDPTQQIDARKLMCDPPIGSAIPLDDLAQALVGMHPRDVWVTRLEGNLARTALANDLELTAAPHQTPVPGVFAASFGTNVPQTCKLSTWSAPPPPVSRGPRWNRYAGAIALALMGVLLVMRRAIRRRQRPQVRPSAGVRPSLAPLPALASRSDWKAVRG